MFLHKTAPPIYRMSTWDKIITWFSLILALAFVSAPTIVSLVIDGSWTSGLLIQAFWIAVLIALARA
jgi:hypothetical protein